MSLFWWWSSLLWPFQTMLIISFGNYFTDLIEQPTAAYDCVPMRYADSWQVPSPQTLISVSIHSSLAHDLNSTRFTPLHPRITLKIQSPDHIWWIDSLCFLRLALWWQTVAHRLFLNPLSTLRVRCWEAALTNGILAATCRVRQRKHQTLNITGSYHYIHRSICPWLWASLSCWALLRSIAQ